jgi:hypothetical protein
MSNDIDGMINSGPDPEDAKVKVESESGGLLLLRLWAGEGGCSGSWYSARNSDSENEDKGVIAGSEEMVVS